MMKIIAELFMEVLIQVIAMVVLQLMDKIAPAPWL